MYRLIVRGEHDRLVTRGCCVSYAALRTRFPCTNRCCSVGVGGREFLGFRLAIGYDKVLCKERMVLVQFHKGKSYIQTQGRAIIQV